MAHDGLRDRDTPRPHGRSVLGAPGRRSLDDPQRTPEADESPLDTARREFDEELGLPAPESGFVDLGEVKQSGGKVVQAWAVEVDLDPDSITPGTFEMQWPLRSGRMATFPEIDRVQWMGPDEARVLAVRAQATFVDRLVALRG